MKIIAWLLGTKAGQLLLLVLAVVLACFLTYRAIAGPAYERGKLEAHAQCIGDQAIANQRRATQERTQREAASRIAADAFKAGQASVQATAATLNTTKGVIHDVYREPISTKPVAAGSCVHALDKRVQDRIDQAVRAANGSP